jgi:hypothetical protein
MIVIEAHRRTWGKKCTRATLSTKNSTYTGLRLNSGLRSKIPRLTAYFHFKKKSCGSNHCAK